MVRGSSAKIIIQLIQPSKNLRYIPDSGATITLALLKSDGTTLTKTATNPFADDRSIIEIDLLSSETSTIISQNLNLTITEGSDVTYAIVQNGLQMVSLTQGC